MCPGTKKPGSLTGSHNMDCPVGTRKVFVQAWEETLALLQAERSFSGAGRYAIYLNVLFNKKLTVQGTISAFRLCNTMPASCVRQMCSSCARIIYVSCPLRNSCSCAVRVCLCASKWILGVQVQDCSLRAQRDVVLSHKKNTSLHEGTICLQSECSCAGT